MKIDETSAGIIIFVKKENKNLFLLLHYPSGHWDFVKGRMENNETYQQTAIRELKEETGITHIKFIENFKEIINYEYTHEQKKIQKQVIFFLGETNTTEIKLSDEHQDFIWLEFDEALNQITYENAKKIFKKAKICLNAV